MTAVLLIMTGPALLWALTHRHLQRFLITGPLLMVALGAVCGWFVADESTAFFDSKFALLAAELILALLLFVDAVELRGSLRSHLAAVPVRLLAIALPLSLAFVLLVASRYPWASLWSPSSPSHAWQFQSTSHPSSPSSATVAFPNGCAVGSPWKADTTTAWSPRFSSPPSPWPPPQVIPKNKRWRRSPRQHLRV